ncbi:MAG: hypothetical protein RBG13Loki_3901 [Promethearchaeota archaeon CR_4]|nr:MAG: hypothetical protein RBG13Loki_3901 [Candidatus Lokiarchaeota archaeon CR_4]
MNVQIRVATPNDVEALRALMKELVAYMDEDFVEKRFEWGIQRRLYDPLQRHGLLIAEDLDEKNRSVGMIFAELRVDPFGRSEGYIKQLIVTADYRGKHIGGELLEQAIDHLRKINVEKVLINVKKGRAKTVEELYKKLKFQEKYSVMERVFNND